MSKKSKIGDVFRLSSRIIRVRKLIAHYFCLFVWLVGGAKGGEGVPIVTIYSKPKKKNHRQY